MSEYAYRVGESTITVRVKRRNARVQVAIDGRSYDVTVQRHRQHDGGDELCFSLDAERHRAYVAHGKDRRFVWLDGDAWTLQPDNARSPQRRPASPLDEEASLRATMPGQVVDVLVAPGDAVKPGDTLVLLEAMKMELRITAPYAGRVDAIHCATGATVTRDQVLVELTRDV